MIIIGLSSGEKKKKPGEFWLAVSTLLPRSGPGSRGFGAIEEWLEPECASELSEIPGVYEITTSDVFSFGKKVTVIDSVKLVTKVTISPA